MNPQKNNSMLLENKMVVRVLKRNPIKVEEYYLNFINSFKEKQNNDQIKPFLQRVKSKLNQFGSYIYYFEVCFEQDNEGNFINQKWM